MIQKYSKNIYAYNPFKTIMDTWTYQMGFPLVTLTKEGNEIVASQKRFLLSVKTGNESNLPKSKYDYKWYIPLTFITSNDSEAVSNIWMNMTDGKCSGYS